MIYKFKSKAAGDVIMLGPNGDHLLRLLGREPAARGIVEVAAMADAIAALERAVAEDEAARAGRGAQGAAHGRDEAEPGAAGAVSLRQRVWPFVDLLKRARAAGEPVVWGV